MTLQVLFKGIMQDNYSDYFVLYYLGLFPADMKDNNNNNGNGSWYVLFIIY